MQRISVLVFILIQITIFSFAQNAKHTFSLGDSTFLLDGKPFVMISGELHYPRIPREAWRHRMKMAKAMGLNTIGTYVFWNIHEPQKGKFDFSGNNDIAAFVKTAQEEGLWVVLRPSPYVCAEWEFGGYPYWLQKENGLVVRSLEPKFINAYKNYLGRVAKELAPLQVNHGGNVLMVQVENEYGFYGTDQKYLEASKQMFRDAGFDGLLYTCDPAAKVEFGRIPGLLPAVNGVLTADEVKQTVKRYHDGKGPYYVAEWYPAWFDWWGAPHHTVPAEDYAPKLDATLAAGISINMYMFHGGTTRGFMNGANCNDKDPFEPQISSYDYDAPLDEAGNPTSKFFAFRNIIKKHSTEKLPDVPARKPSVKLQDIVFTQSQSLFDVAGKGVRSVTPITFEDLDQPYGFVLYRTELKNPKSGTLKINDVRDYAIVFVNGKRVGVLDRRLKQDSLFVQMPKGKVKLEILVENLGRINFGPYLHQNKKGITRNVLLNNDELVNWEMFRLPLNDISTIKFRQLKANAGGPIFKKGVFDIGTPVDTYLNFEEWGKGVVWVNGHNLGRYWNIGPQQTIYLPAEWLKAGENEIIVFELFNNNDKLISTDAPVLNQLAEKKLTYQGPK